MKVGLIHGLACLILGLDDIDLLALTLEWRSEVLNVPLTLVH